MPSMYISKGGLAVHVCRPRPARSIQWQLFAGGLEMAAIQ